MASSTRKYVLCDAACGKPFQSGSAAVDLPHPDPVIRQRELQAQLSREFVPVGAAEQLLVNEMARRAASLELWARATHATQATAAVTIGDWAVRNVDDLDPNEARLACAMGCETSIRAERASAAQSRAFHRALESLLALQDRRKCGDSETPSAPLPLLTEEAAMKHLVAHRLQNFLCAQCGARKAYYLSSRGCLECFRCGMQSGLRVGTIMEKSRLALVTWFAAIGLALNNPEIPARLLQQKLGIKRAATALAIRRKIRSAMAAPTNAPLAGVDGLLLQPELSGAEKQNFAGAADAS